MPRMPQPTHAQKGSRRACSRVCLHLRRRKSHNTQAITGLTWRDFQKASHCHMLRRTVFHVFQRLAKRLRHRLARLALWCWCLFGMAYVSAGTVDLTAYTRNGHLQLHRRYSHQGHCHRVATGSLYPGATALRNPTWCLGPAVQDSAERAPNPGLHHGAQKPSRERISRDGWGRLRPRPGYTAACPSINTAQLARPGAVAYRRGTRRSGLPGSAGRWHSR